MTKDKHSRIGDSSLNARNDDDNSNNYSRATFLCYKGEFNDFIEGKEDEKRLFGREKKKYLIQGRWIGKKYGTFVAKLQGDNVLILHGNNMNL